MIPGLVPPAEERRRGRPSELGEKRAPLLAAARRRHVQLDVAEAARRGRADVGSVDRHIERNPALEGDVPGLNVAATHVVGIGRTHRRGRRQRHAAHPRRRAGEFRNALIDRAVRLPTVEAHVRVLDCQGISAPQRPGERERVVREPVSGARDGELVDAPRGAEPWREIGLARLEPDVARNAADAAEQHLHRVQVEAFDALPIGARDQREVLVADAEIERHVPDRLPPIAEIESVPPLARPHRLPLDRLLHRRGQAEQE